MVHGRGIPYDSAVADLYEVLQVHRRAEADVIRAAYRTLARKYHPDLGGDQRRMTAINEAWAILGDPRLRAAYDAASGWSEPQPRPQHHQQAREPQARQAQARGQQAESTGAAAGHGHTAHQPPPPGRQSGTVLDFGRYAGWSLGQLAGHDANYLEWLSRTPIGRPLRAEIEGLLASKASTTTATHRSVRQQRRRPLWRS
jgi:curved DNA-binding protein CbpA